jgi:hypothetical protein
MSSSVDYSSSDDEWDMLEEEDIAMSMDLHHNSNKRPKHGGLVLGHEKLWRDRIEGAQQGDVQLFC